MLPARAPTVNESIFVPFVPVVDRRTTFAPAQPQLVFDGVYNLRSDTGISYAVAPKGDRFLMVRLTDENTASTLTLVTNWFTELRRLTASTAR